MSLQPDFYLTNNWGTDGFCIRHTRTWKKVSPMGKNSLIKSQAMVLLDEPQESLLSSRRGMTG
ncbi:hypothetical protein DPMN_014042 [Dreissena polymorpha]|uniref:Uncharacterized protein n=1 Tax=Dreissena polymorpha TaxID=45954 RepID=A0A9D4N904_DREPO|nr:hypothetical protein DPMN_014042 [Dreissena polymorpha]